MRKLASVRKIDSIDPIPGADAIEVCTVGGWKVVVKKGEYQAGDLAIYCEVDSWIPTELAPFLTKGKEPREYNGVKGERLKTIKLRGQLSQGLLLPISNFLGATFVKDKSGETILVNEGDDLTEFLGIQKWEKTIPAQLAGTMRGNFPSAIPKTDQERVQNLVFEINAARKNNLLFEVTEKLEGSSCTFYLDRDGEFHVCSRNIDLKRDENNSFWRAAIKYDVEQKMRYFDLTGIAIQGELIGPSIQGNIYDLKDIEFHVFDVYDEFVGRYLIPRERMKIVEELDLKHVPSLGVNIALQDVESIIAYADGKSFLNDRTNREGIVFKQMDGGITFKCVSNEYLMKSKD